MRGGSPLLVQANKSPSAASSAQPPHRPGGSRDRVAWTCRERALSHLKLLGYVASVEWKLHSKGKQRHRPLSPVLFYRLSCINHQLRHRQGFGSAWKSCFARAQRFVPLGAGEGWTARISGLLLPASTEPPREVLVLFYQRFLSIQCYLPISSCPEVRVALERMEVQDHYFI